MAEPAWSKAKARMRATAARTWDALVQYPRKWGTARISSRVFGRSQPDRELNADFGVLVNPKIVPDHDIARLEQRSEVVPGPFPHGVGVHRSGKQQRGVDTLDVECGDHRIRFPATSRDVIDDSLTPGSPCFSASQRQVDPTLVDEPEPRATPATSPMLEALSSGNYVRARALAGAEALFFRVRPRRRRLRHIVVSLTLRRVERSRSFANSTNVASGCLSTSSRSLRSFAPATKRSLPGAFPA